MLSQRTLQAIEILYPLTEREVVREILESECSKTKLGCAGWSTSQMERIWFAVLKLGSEAPGTFLDAVELARTDWRDLLMAANFGEDINLHKKWWQDISR